MTTLRTTVTVLLIWLLGMAAGQASDIPSVLLIENRSEGLSSRIDRATLEQSSHVSELSTATPWDKDVKRFTGLPLMRLPELAGVDGDETITLTALNDYNIELPPEWRQQAFLAWAQDGTYQKPDDKGYFWVLFDFDAMSDSAVKEVQSLAIWQLFRIEVRPR